MDIKNYRDLEVWKKAMDLVLDCYRLTKDFPRTEVYGLADQLQRAAVSVPANIAEGRGRRYTKEFLHHISIAYGSLAELETLVQIAERLSYIKPDESTHILDQTAEICRMLNGLRNSLNAKA